MARTLQNRLALARYKTTRGWEHLPLDTIEDELRRQRPRSSGDGRSVSSASSASDSAYPPSRTLLTSPLKATVFSDDPRSAASTGHRKRFYDPHSRSSIGSRKRPCSSPSRDAARDTWSASDHFTQSSPIKPHRQLPFTTSQGPNLSFSRSTAHLPNLQRSPDLPVVAPAPEDTNMPAHSFDLRSSPPRTPPSTRPTEDRRPRETLSRAGEEGADLLLYLASSPSPAKPLGNRFQPPSTPPSKNLALPSSMMTTPGGGGTGTGTGIPSFFGAPSTPAQGFDFADFVNITPSPAQNAWPKTPRTIKTPLTVARRRLNFDTMLPPSASPTV